MTLIRKPEHDIIPGHKKSGQYLKDIVYGANDGIITTFAIVAGVAGAGLGSKVIVLLGFANLLADGFSMAASNYLGICAATYQLAGGPLRKRKLIDHAPWKG